MSNLSAIMDQIKKLSENERKKIVSMLMSSHDTEANTSLSFTEERFSNGFFCPHCGCVENIVKFGKSPNGEQRFKCKNCGKTFIAKTNTIFCGSHKSFDLWMKFLECMVDQFSIRKTAVICDINTHTAFVWRHKVLDAIASYNESKKLKGVIEADETFFRVSYKGSRNLPEGRKAKKRGTPAEQNGLSKEQVCVECVIDRNGNKVSEIVSLGPADTKTLHEVLDDKIIRGAIFCTDGFRTYGLYAEDNFGYIKHVVVNEEKRKNGIYHINHVNAYHSFIKLFVGKFRGVSTKYLQNYLEWCNTAYGVSGEDMKKLNIVKPAVRSSFAKKWEEIGDRPSLPVAA